MKSRPILLLIALVFAFALLGWFSRPLLVQKAADAEPAYQVGDTLTPGSVSTGAESAEISWDDLIPVDWLPEEWLLSLNLDELEDGDPQTDAVLEKILEEWERAPVVESMDGRRIRIPGFVVPLEGDGRTITEFLLVPYFGACVHVPPPPSNQLIHVLPDEPIPGDWNMVPVWVEGILSVTRVDSELGSAGYQVRASAVEEFEEDWAAEPLPH